MGQNGQAAMVIPVQERVGLGMFALDDFTPLVQAHQQRIYRVLLGMVRDPDAAETLTQECFLKAYQKRASFRGEASVGVWLLKIAVNLARDHRRSRLREFWDRIEVFIRGSRGPRAEPGGPAGFPGACHSGARKCRRRLGGGSRAFRATACGVCAALCGGDEPGRNFGGDFLEAGDCEDTSCPSRPCGSAAVQE